LLLPVLALAFLSVIPEGNLLLHLPLFSHLLLPYRLPVVRSRLDEGHTIAPSPQTNKTTAGLTSESLPSSG
jgi:hypothetical protein